MSVQLKVANTHTHTRAHCAKPFVMCDLPLATHTRANYDCNLCHFLMYSTPSPTATPFAYMHITYVHVCGLWSDNMLRFDVVDTFYLVSAFSVRFGLSSICRACLRKSRCRPYILTRAYALTHAPHARTRQCICREGGVMMNYHFTPSTARAVSGASVHACVFI